MPIDPTTYPEKYRNISNKQKICKFTPINSFSFLGLTPQIFLNFLQSKIPSSYVTHCSRRSCSPSRSRSPRRSVSFRCSQTRSFSPRHHWRVWCSSRSPRHRSHVQCRSRSPHQLRCSRSQSQWQPLVLSKDLRYDCASIQFRLYLGSSSVAPCHVSLTVPVIQEEWCKKM